MGSRKSTTWTKETRPTPPKGVKKRKTILKEKIGAGGWEALAEFMKVEGARKAVREMKKLKEKDYVTAYNAMSEFFKPKLSRTEVKQDSNITLEGEVKVVFE